MERLNRHANDAVSELLAGIAVQSAVYCVSEFRAPWGFRVERSDVAKFHLILDGSALLELEGGQEQRILPGEFILLPQGDGHSVRDRRGSRVRRLERVLADHPLDEHLALRYGGRGRRTRVVCGGFALRDQLPLDLHRMLPRVVRLDARRTGIDRWLDPLFALLDDEHEPGKAAVFAKIADVFLTETLRTYLVAAQAAGVVAVAPLADPAIAEAVQLLHDRSEEPWTIAKLAGAVGMSRTKFSATFRTLLGQPPIQYLARIRLARAAGLLTTTDDNLYAIARATGYESEASFSKAFKRTHHVAPGEYRRRRDADLVDLEQDPQSGMP